MKYNPAFKDTKALFECLGVESSWASSEMLSSLDQTLIACTCCYLEQLFPKHEQNILQMTGKELLEYMNALTGTDLLESVTISEAFSTWFRILRKMSLVNASTSP